MAKEKKGLGIGTLVLIGFGLGIATGLFFGETAAILIPIGRAYVRLLQMAVIPFIMVSLIAGLGRLTPRQASRIAAWGGTVLLLILGIGMVPVLLAPLAYPDWEAASYFSSSLAKQADTVDFVGLYIAANPFDALANTVVPAIVLFSIVMGVAVMLSQRKAPLLDLLGSLEEALMNVSRFVVKLAPIGIFAIAANAAGTLDLHAFGKLQIYVLTFLLLWVLLFFVFLPLLLTALTPIGYFELMRTFRVPFITALVTGSVLVVLPMMIERIRRLLVAHDIADEETESAVDVLVPTTYNFPTVAMLLVLSFILFSGWYAGNSLDIDRYPLFSLVGLFVAFGGSNIALPFLLDLFRMPADMFDLFLVANVITNFFFTSLSTMNLAVLTVLTIFFIKGRVKPKPARAGVLAGLLLLGTPLVLMVSGAVFDAAIPYEYRGYAESVSRGLAHPTDARAVEYDSGRAPGRQPSTLAHIESTGSLRVGYSPDALPWAFRNEEGDVVGFDMELVHRLAAELGVSLDLVRVVPREVSHALASGQIDIYASGLMVDPARVREFGLSEPYAEVTLGVLIEDHRRREVESVEKIKAATDSTFAVLQSPSLLRALELSAPGLKFEAVDTPRGFLRGELPGVDAVIMSAEAASAWTLVYPNYSAVVPTPSGVTIPIVFALPTSDTEFRSFIDNWIRSSIALRVMDNAYERWILGRETVEREPRWSIIRDVLHWME